MKDVVIVPRGRYGIYEARVKPEDKVKNVLNRLELGRGFLIRSSYSESDSLRGNDLLYQKVENYEELYFYSTEYQIHQIQGKRR